MTLRMMAAAVAVALSVGGAAQAANFVSNPGFELSSGGATSATFGGGGGVSAATDWQLYNNEYAPTATERLASTAPGGGGQMLHVSSGGDFNGIYQLLGSLARYASVNVNVRSGSVALYLYSNSGTSQQGHAFSSGTGWQTLSLDTGAANSNEIVIYTHNGAADFDVDNAYASDEIQPVSTAPEPASWALMIAGFGLAGGAFRRRRAVAGA